MVEKQESTEFPGRWAVVCYEDYYPSASLRNIRGRFPTKALAKAFAKGQESQYWDHIEVHDLLKLVQREYIQDSNY